MMEKLSRFWEGFCANSKKVGKVLKKIWVWFYRLRSLILAIPVGVTAVILAVHNSVKLPDMVGWDLQASGEFAKLISKNAAIFGPLSLTAVCILLMFCSRKVVYPWLISIFSLTLPLLIWFINTFPG